MLKFKVNKSFLSEKKWLLQPELCGNWSCCIKPEVPAAQDFGLLLSGITDLSPELCASTPSHMAALQTAFPGSFPKDLELLILQSHERSSHQTLTPNAHTVPFLQTVQGNKRRSLSPKVQSPSQISWELSTREEDRTHRVSALSVILHTKGF